MTRSQEAVTPSADDPASLTLAEAAAWVGVSPRTLDRWAEAGRIPSSVTVMGLRTFRRDELRKRAVWTPRRPGT